MSQHEQFCQACGMPMSAPDAHSASDQYCAYCSDSNGNLKPWEEAVSGLASFLDSWQKVGPEEAHKLIIYTPSESIQEIRCFLTLCWEPTTCHAPLHSKIR